MVKLTAGILFLFALSWITSAQADMCDQTSMRTFIGADADDLGFILMHASYAERIANEDNAIAVFKIEALNCKITARGVLPDGMHDYACKTQKNLGPLNSKLIIDTLARKGVRINIDQDQFTVQSIQCSSESPSRRPFENPICEVTALWNSNLCPDRH